MAPLIRVVRRGGALAIAAGDALLRAYANLLFSRSRVAGALVLAATATEPRYALVGLLAVVAAAIAAPALGLAPGSIAERPYGYSALLVGLGVAHGFEAGPSAAALAIGGGALTVLVTAALTSLAAKVGEPPLLSASFLVVTWSLGGAAPLLGVAPAAVAHDPPGDPLALGLTALGSLVFLPTVAAGAIVLAALVVHSRIAALLATMGIGLVVLLAQIGDGEAVGAIAQPLALNAFLTAVAVGGVFYVPSTSSFALAALGAIISMALTASIARPFGALGLAPLILPFNASALLVLFAARQRVKDAHPQGIDFAPGSPEENLAYAQTRRARFRALYGVEFRLPFRGAWTCTQGVDGALTHQKQWRHAFDFEVQGADGGRFHGAGASVEDHLCYRLPVLAAADGTVVKVENAVPDNAVGGLELRQNWGNAVVVHHAPGLYSLVAHLAEGSARVVEGQFVRRGEVLGLCGNSGRSPRPHLHFQLQAAPQLGAATLPCRFSDVVVGAGGTETVPPAVVPGEGETLRNLAPDEGMAPFFDVVPGTALTVRVGDRTETLESEVDLYGRRVLRSRELGATLFFGRTDDTFTSFDAIGPSRSAVHLLRKALGRVRFDGSEALSWKDHLPARAIGSPLLRPLCDLASPFLPSAGVEMEYRARREGEWIEITGRSRPTRRGGEPAVRTRAWLSRTAGLVAIEVIERGRSERLARLDAGGVEIVSPVTFERPPDRVFLALANFGSRPGESS